MSPSCLTPTLGSLSQRRTKIWFHQSGSRKSSCVAFSYVQEARGENQVMFTVQRPSANVNCELSSSPHESTAWCCQWCHNFIQHHFLSVSGNIWIGKCYYFMQKTRKTSETCGNQSWHKCQPNGVEIICWGFFNLILRVHCECFQGKMFQCHLSMLRQTKRTLICFLCGSVAFRRRAPQAGRHPPPRGGCCFTQGLISTGAAWPAKWLPPGLIEQ